MPFSTRAIDLARLNALTRYPSILTFHPLDPKQSRSRGKTADVRPQVTFAGPVLVTEKIDGVNTRIVIPPDRHWLIGSRDEFLYALGDLLHSPALGIVDTVRPLIDAIATAAHDPNALVVWFGEVFGGKVTDASSQYTGEQRLGFRLFDILTIPEPARMSADGQRFASEDELQRSAERAGVPLTPRLGEVSADELPASLDDARAFLDELLPTSLAALDTGAGGRPEGVVIRTRDRSATAKLRFRDYPRDGKPKRKR